METLQQGIEALRARLDEAEQILYAIAHHEVDAFVVTRAQGPQIYKLEGAEHPYRTMVETINEGAATLAEGGVISYCNPALAALLKVPRQQLVGATLSQFVLPEDLPFYAALFAQGLAGRSKGEITLLATNGARLPVLLSWSSLQLEELRSVCLVATDLTEQKQQLELIASEKLTRAILEQVVEAVIVCDPGGRIIRVNRQALQLCGRNPNLQPFGQMFPLQWSEAAQSGVEYPAQSAESRGPLSARSDFNLAATFNHGAVRNQEVQFTAPDGRLYYLLLSAVPLLDDEQQQLGYVITLVDISARREGEEALRQARDDLETRVVTRTNELRAANHLLEQEIAERSKIESNLAEVRRLLTQSQEAERLRLAQDMHDGPLQEVIALRFELSELAQSLSDEAAKAHVIGLGKQVGQMAQHLREVTQNLRPPILAHLGLAAALRVHVQQVQSVQPVPTVQLIVSEESWPLSEDCALSLFRIYQQALQNALQHAKAQQVTIRLTYEQEQLHLTIEDDGCGFHVPEQWVELARQGHLGMVGIVERAEAIGGHVEVESAPGRGARVQVILPKPQENASQAEI
jgi:PAS domain S-box-containing protein